MIGFTSDSSSGKETPLVDINRYVENLVSYLQWDGVHATVEHKEMPAAVGFGKRQMAVISFEAEAGGQSRSEAQNFARFINRLFSEPGKDGELYPMFKSNIASVTEDSKAAIDTDLLKAAFRDEYSRAKGLLGNVLKYARERQVDDTLVIPRPSKPSTFGFTAQRDDVPLVSSGEIFSCIKDAAKQMKWGGVEVDVERKTLHNGIGFGISNMIILLSFKGEGARTWTLKQHQDEALNFADYLNQCVNMHLPEHSPSAEDQGIITAAQEGVVVIQPEKLRSLIKEHPEMLNNLQGAMQDYAMQEQQILQERDSVALELDLEQAFAGTPVAERLTWLQEMQRVFTNPTGVTTLLDMAGEGERAKFEQFCAELGQYVQMKAEAPEKFAKMQRDYPVYARTVEAYEGYLQRQKKQVVEEPQAPAPSTWVKTCKVDPGLRVNRQPDGSFDMKR